MFGVEVLFIAMVIVALTIGVMIGWIARPLFDDELHQARAAAEANRRQAQRVKRELLDTTPYPISEATQK